MLCLLKPQSRCNLPGRGSRGQLIGQLLLVFRDGVRCPPSPPPDRRVLDSSFLSQQRRTRLTGCWPNKTFEVVCCSSSLHWSLCPLFVLFNTQGMYFFFFFVPRLWHLCTINLHNTIKKPCFHQKKREKFLSHLSSESHVIITSVTFIFYQFHCSSQFLTDGTCQELARAQRARVFCSVRERCPTYLMSLSLGLREKKRLMLLPLNGRMIQIKFFSNQQH